MTPTFTQPRVVIRPTLPADTPAVLEFCKRIWNGHDYIPLVWDEWQSDPKGMLFSAEYAGKAVGIARIVHMAAGQWWFEGFRVDPTFQDRHIGTQLHEYIVDWWLAHGDGKVRLWTNAKRVKVHHLCERMGFTQTQARGMYAAPPLAEPVNAFIPLKMDEVPAAVDFARQVSSLSVSGETMDIGWQVVTPNETSLGELLNLEDGRALWWRNRQGLLCLWENDEYEPPCLAIAMAASTSADLHALLLNARRYIHQNGFHKIVWNACLSPQLDATLASAGFAREDDESNFEYERQHPTRYGDLKKA
jgi:GNAT superfamily N-acetyltransferase